MLIWSGWFPGASEADCGTDRAGFEPAKRFEPFTRFPGVPLQPLEHLSRRRQGRARGQSNNSHGPSDEGQYRATGTIVQRVIAPDLIASIEREDK